MTAQRLVLFSILIIIVVVAVPSSSVKSPTSAGIDVRGLRELGPQYRLTADITAERYEFGGFSFQQIKNASIVTVLGDPNSAAAGKIFVVFDHQEIRVNADDIRTHAEQVRR